jgi:biotin carboxyl carrier protein
MVQVAEKAAEIAGAEGIDAEVIDPRTIVPLDEETLLDSVKKTSRAIVIDEGHQSYGVTAEIASRLNEKAFYHLDAPVLRMGAMDVPVPFSPALEDLTVPTPEGVVETRASSARGSSFMPHDVTMPQLGMAQDAGKIVSWLKSPGDAVARGDALFEVETDKAVMEVESPADGFLTGVSYGEGEDVPVGQVIARISDSAKDDAPAAEPADRAQPAVDSRPTHPARGPFPVTMPQLGMAQDTGILVNWLKAPGDAVAADDILFEVETDKSTMEVEAGRAGYPRRDAGRGGRRGSGGRPRRHHLRGQTRGAGCALGPGRWRRLRPGGRARDGRMRPNRSATGQAAPAPRPQPPPPHPAGRILASPKARRLARNRGSTSTGWSRRAIRNPSTLRTSTCCAPCPPARRPVRAKRRAADGDLRRRRAAGLRFLGGRDSRPRSGRGARRSCGGQPAGRTARLPWPSNVSARSTSSPFRPDAHCRGWPRPKTPRAARPRPARHAAGVRRDGGRGQCPS